MHSGCFQAKTERWVSLCFVHAEPQQILENPLITLFVILWWVSWTKSPTVFQSWCFWGPYLRWKSKKMGGKCWVQTLGTSGEELGVVSSFPIACLCARDGFYGETASQPFFTHFSAGIFSLAWYTGIAQLVSVFLSAETALCIAMDSVRPWAWAACHLELESCYNVLMYYLSVSLFEVKGVGNDGERKKNQNNQFY